MASQTSSRTLIRTTLIALSLGTADSLPAQLADMSRIQTLTLNSQVFRNTRAVRVYLPPGYFDAANSARRYPVLYLNDGFALFRHMRAPAIADSLIEKRLVRPFILVGIDNAASIAGETQPLRARTNEYLPYPERLEPDLPEPEGRRYPAFLLDEVLPLVESKVRVATSPRERGIGGSSYGAIAALHTMIERPGLFESLMLESAPFFISENRLVRESRQLLGRRMRIYVGMGENEAPEGELKVSLFKALSEFSEMFKGAPTIQFQLNRVPGHEHNSSAWRERLPAALIFLFGT